ncbi:hypothetical protein ACU4GD_36035 [Cupriavidus basilensis]
MKCAAFTSNAAPTIGEVGNEEHSLRRHRQGRCKSLARYPPDGSRLCVMNPVDHPHGGGEGKTAAGRDPVSPWGTPG